MNSKVHKSVSVAVTCLISIISFTACPTNENQDMQMLLLMSLLQGTNGGSGGGEPTDANESSICMTIEEETITTYNSSKSINLGQGFKTFYETEEFYFKMGPSSPGAIVYARQDHSYNSTTDYRPVFPIWRNQFSIEEFYNFELWGNQDVISMHAYGRNTFYYGIGSHSTMIKGIDYTVKFHVPDDTLAVDVKTVQNCNEADEQEASFSGNVDLSTSRSGLDQVWKKRKRMNVNFIFIEGTYPSYSVESVQAAADRMKAIYGQDTVGIDLEFAATSISQDEFQTITDLTDVSGLLASSVSKLYMSTAAAQQPYSLNIYITAEETAVGGVLGLAGGIPGLPGITGTAKSAMIVFLEPHRRTGSSGEVLSDDDLRFLGDTMAHEAGHFLGLFHLVESSGALGSNSYVKDPLIETPACSSFKDDLSEGGNDNEIVEVSECLGSSYNDSGGLNLMFWAGDGITDQSQLTGEQGWVLRLNPLSY